MTAAAVLRVDAVSVVRSGRAILDDANLEIRPGEHWALIGANGAGKSTLLNLLGARTHPTRGTVEVLGRRIGRVDMQSLRALIGYVDPRHELMNPLTVRQVVTTGAAGTTELPMRWSPTDEMLERSDEVIAELGLAARANAVWPTLSQGERGRTLIARALQPSPRVLLLDEPATGLDLKAREVLLGALDRLRAQHPDLASVMVTHHLEELPASTTHALVLRDGVTVAQGAAGEVLTSEVLSSAFDHPIEVTRAAGRWQAMTAAG